jgi:excisionase family DNA binding protein
MNYINKEQRRAAAAPITSGFRPLLNYDEAMALLGIRARSTLYLMLKRGEIHASRVGRAVRFHVDEIERVQRGRSA